MWPSTGDLRFGLPQPPLPFDGTRQATAFGAACPQQSISINRTLFRDFKFPPISNISEDCMLLFISNFSIESIHSAGLFINVVRPVNVSSHKLLPVVFVSLQVSKRLTKLRQSPSVYIWRLPLYLLLSVRINPDSGSLQAASRSATRHCS